MFAIGLHTMKTGLCKEQPVCSCSIWDCECETCSVEQLFSEDLRSSATWKCIDYT